MGPEALERAFGHVDRDIHNTIDRPALVVALMTELQPGDLNLVRRLILFEMDRIRDEGSGTSEVLIACCWLLFRGGDPSDASLVWQAKTLNFDTSCMIDSALLAPAGTEATLALALSLGFTALADHMESQAGAELDQDITHWRKGTYWGDIPAADAPREELAGWINS